MSIDTRLDVLKQIIDTQQLKEENKNYNIHHKMYDFVLKLVESKNYILYGGFALNLLLPKKHRIYKNKILPDIDCFSQNAKEDAIYIANSLKDKGYQFIEVKSAIHEGTYKVYAEFLPIADITQISNSMFEYLTNHSIIINNLHICPSEFLMWSLYKELARPEGSGHRWEKIYSRYLIFQKHYKFKDRIRLKCISEISPSVDKFALFIKKNKWPIIGQKAISLYLNIECKPNENMYAFDIIVDNIDTAFETIKNLYGDTNITLKTHTTESLKELTTRIGFVKHNNTRLCKMYETDSCYSFQKKNNFTVGSVDTILHFLYGHYMISTYYNDNNTDILRRLIIIFEKYALTLDIKQRFRVSCYGYEKTLLNVRKELWGKKLFNYRP
jgi:hypothetical protein